MGYTLCSFLRTSRSLFERSCNSRINCFECLLFTAGIRYKSTSVAADFSAATHTSQKLKQKPLDYCIDLVKRRDYEGYLYSLLLPQRARAAVFAVRAFNVELANIREQIQQHGGIADILRLQFWKDTVNALYPEQDSALLSKQPVADVLRNCVHRGGRLSKKFLMDLVEARQNNLHEKGFESVDEVRDYALKTHGALLFLTLEALGIYEAASDSSADTGCSDSSFHVASELAKALGFVTLIKSFAPLASNGIILIPADLQRSYRVTPSQLLEGEFSYDIQNLSWSLGDLARSHLKEARRWRFTLPKQSRSVFLCAVTMDRFLVRFAGLDANLYDAQLQQRDNLLPIRLGIERLLGSF